MGALFPDVPELLLPMATTVAALILVLLFLFYKREQQQLLTRPEASNAAANRTIWRKKRVNHDGGVLGDISEEDYEEVEEDGGREEALEDLKRKTLEFGVKFEELKFGKLLGKGSQGEVFSADWRGSKVAVKKIDTRAVEEEIIDEFISEAEIMRRLRHPALTLFMGVSLEAPHLCIVTEFAQRGSLFDILHEEQAGYTWKKALNIALDVAQGMTYLHAHTPPILHRDLKSLNILINESWRAKVADFGMTRFQDTSPNADAMTQCGSPLWMAPEMIKNEIYDEKADVYSFGIVLWELYTREIPYQVFNLNPSNLVVKVVRDKLRPDIPKRCPKQYAELMVKCWAPDPAERPTFVQILEKLETICNNRKIKQHKPKAMRNAIEEEEDDSDDEEDELDAANALPNKSKDPMEDLMANAPSFGSGSDAYLLKEADRNTHLTVDFSLLPLQHSEQIVQHRLHSPKDRRKSLKQGEQFSIQTIATANGGQQGVVAFIPSSPGGVVSNIPADPRRSPAHSIPSTPMNQNGSAFLESFNSPYKCYRGKYRGKNIVLKKFTWNEISSNVPTANTTANPSTHSASQSNSVSSESIRTQSDVVMIPCDISEEEKQQIIQYLDKISSFRHPNLVLFMGAYIDFDHVGVIEEEIGRGSLYCHLHDTHAPLEWELQLNFLVDIAQGLQYLHHVNSIHPDLTTRKILVTAQWRAKIGCYEFTHLQEKLKNNGVNMHKKDQLNAFTAPELFDKDTPITAASNVYSFAIIMWHIMTRKNPYDGHINNRVKAKVLEGFRLPLPSLSLSNKLKTLIRACWHTQPEKRPTFDLIVKTLLEIREEGPPKLVLDDSNSSCYRKAKTVFAYVSKDPLTVLKAWGKNIGTAGSYLVVSDDQDLYMCERSVFQQTYEPAEHDNEYRKVGTVRAKKMDEDFAIKTTSGSVEQGKKGDFLLQNDKLDQWVVDSKTFSSLYELVGTLNPTPTGSSPISPSSATSATKGQDIAITISTHEEKTHVPSTTSASSSQIVNQTAPQKTPIVVITPSANNNNKVAQMPLKTSSSASSSAVNSANKTSAGPNFMSPETAISIVPSPSHTNATAPRPQISDNLKVLVEEKDQYTLQSVPSSAASSTSANSRDAIAFIPVDNPAPAPVPLHQKKQLAVHTPASRSISTTPTNMTNPITPISRTVKHNVFREEEKSIR